MQQIFPMAAPGATAKNFMRGLIAFMVAMAFVSVGFTPSPVRWLVLFVWIICLWMLYRIHMRMGQVVFQVGGGVLHVQGDFFRRDTPVSAIRFAEARLLDLHSDRSLAPTVRVAGTAMPGYLSGWFRLRSGEKSFISVTDQSKAVYLPTTLGYSILLTPDDPQAFLAAVRAAHL